MFVGLIAVPIIGNAAEHSSAVMFALRDKVDVTLEVAIGSSTQIALFVAPALVFVSLLVGHPMDFVFSTFEVAAVALSTFLVFAGLGGRSIELVGGAQLVGAYVIVAVSFYFVQLMRAILRVCVVAVGIVVSAGPASAQSNETIGDYRVQIEILPDGDLRIAERIAYGFGSQLRHGIFPVDPDARLLRRNEDRA